MAIGDGGDKKGPGSGVSEETLLRILRIFGISLAEFEGEESPIPGQGAHRRHGPRDPFQPPGSGALALPIPRDPTFTEARGKRLDSSPIKEAARGEEPRGTATTPPDLPRASAGRRK